MLGGFGGVIDATYGLGLRYYEYPILVGVGGIMNIPRMG